MVVEYFTKIKTPVPSYISFNKNLACWALRAGLPEAYMKEKLNKKTGEIKRLPMCPGLTVKSTRKSWESWLIFYYLNHIFDVTLSQGHTTTTSLQHYLNMPFTETDKIEMKNYVEGWI